MKARIFTTTLLMIVALTTFAQTSRRGERKQEQSTRTEENKNNENKPDARKENRRSEPRVEKQTNTEKPAENTQQNRSRRENSGITGAQAGTEIRTNPDNNNTTRDNNRNNNDNNYKPIVNQNNNNNTYKPGESRRPEHDNRVVVSTQHKKEYVRINHNHRKVVVVNHPRNYRPTSVQVRRTYHTYRSPVRREIVWSIEFRNNIRVYYPEVRYWRYEVGYRVPIIPAYDANNYIGDVARIYGKAFEVYYEYETDEYYLYFGDYYPYHDFSIIVPGHEARKISRRPERLFRRSHIEVTGYVTEFDNKPEMIIRNARQIEVY